MKKKREKYDFSEKYVKANRTFPVGNTILLIVLVIVQIAVVLLAVFFEPRPQDIIKQYSVTVEPREDGSLDIEYYFWWEAVDTSEELTWVEIGMANENFTVYPDSVSSTVSSYSKEVFEDYITLRLDFERAYIGGETLQFSFKVNQKDMLCKDGSGYFYEFIPGWFNATPVEKYEFRWKADGALGAENAAKEADYFNWSGSFDCGGYEKMYVRYAPEAFVGCQTAAYYPFDDSGAYNEQEEERGGVIIMACLLVVVLIVVEVYIVDSYVSYNRGRGFLTGYGHHVHIYGRSNPRYIKERDKHAARSGGGYRGGGCACACACACAGGGRAGCSQKDTYSPEKHG